MSKKIRKAKMMRNIKFRGKSSETSQWLYGSLVINGDDVYILPEGKTMPETLPEEWRVEPDTVGQYIGQVDKNSREVYERDYVRDEHDIYGKREGLVVYSEDETAFIIKPLGDSKWYDEMGALFSWNEVEVFDSQWNTLETKKHEMTLVKSGQHVQLYYYKHLDEFGVDSYVLFKDNIALSVIYPENKEKAIETWRLWESGIENSDIRVVQASRVEQLDNGNWVVEVTCPFCGKVNKLLIKDQDIEDDLCEHYHEVTMSHDSWYIFVRNEILAEKLEPPVKR